MSIGEDTPDLATLETEYIADPELADVVNNPVSPYLIHMRLLKRGDVCTSPLVPCAKVSSVTATKIWLQSWLSPITLTSVVITD